MSRRQENERWARYEAHESIEEFRRVWGEFNNSQSHEQQPVENSEVEDD